MKVLLWHALALTIGTIGLVLLSQDVGADHNCPLGKVEVFGFGGGCRSVAWICHAKSSVGTAWGRGWSDSRDAAAQVALSNCNNRGGPCSPTGCSGGNTKSATKTPKKEEIEEIFGKTKKKKAKLEGRMKSDKETEPVELERKTEKHGPDLPPDAKEPVFTEQGKELLAPQRPPVSPLPGPIH